MADDLEALRLDALAKLEASVAAADRTSAVIDADGDWQSDVVHTQAAMREAHDAIERYVMAGGAHVIAGGKPSDLVPLFPVPQHEFKPDANWWFRVALILCVIAFAAAAWALWG